MCTTKVEEIPDVAQDYNVETIGNKEFEISQHWAIGYKPRKPPLTVKVPKRFYRSEEFGQIA